MKKEIFRTDSVEYKMLQEREEEIESLKAEIENELALVSNLSWGEKSEASEANRHLLIKLKQIFETKLDQS